MVGTPDHTAFLVDQIEELTQVTFVGLVPFEGRFDEAASSCAAASPLPFEILPWTGLERDDYDEILVSSHEYMYEVVDALKAAGITKPVYQIYDNTTRSPMQLLSAERASLSVSADHVSRTMVKESVPQVVWPGPKGS